MGHQQPHARGFVNSGQRVVKPRRAPRRPGQWSGRVVVGCGREDAPRGKTRPPAALQSPYRAREAPPRPSAPAATTAPSPPPAWPRAVIGAPRRTRLAPALPPPPPGAASALPPPAPRAAPPPPPPLPYAHAVLSANHIPPISTLLPCRLCGCSRWPPDAGEPPPAPQYRVSAALLAVKAPPIAGAAPADPGPL
ncbi:neural Wiskott-Aldrich syndrome protein-like [Schistocerca americana]|uniref:neural Wiskott-Aldrich syndrome protein-like n=1 Tax=Schistocerca americana TaxID=7009 RepID=UPI001F4F7A76|nr:neural Wiskott-Aldrich syndrome protein-like [Schistocerca americana]